MAGILQDILLPAAAGVGQGFSQGIKDYANIQNIKREEEMLPLQKGIVQAQFTKAQSEQEELGLRKQALAQPWEPLNDPLIKKLRDAAGQDSKDYIDNLFPEGKKFTMRDKEVVKQNLMGDTEMYKHLTSSLSNVVSGEIVKKEGEYNQYLEEINKLPARATGAMGWDVENPDIVARKQKAGEMKTVIDKMKKEREALVGDIGTGSKQVAVNQMYLNNRELIDSKPYLKMMVDLTKDLGDTSDVAKLIDIVARAKDPLIANEVELAIASTLGANGKPDYKLAMDKLLNYKESLKATPSVHITRTPDKAGAAQKADYADINGKTAYYGRDKKYHYTDDDSIVPGGMVKKIGDQLKASDRIKFKRASIAAGIKILGDNTPAPNSNGKDSTPEWQKYLQ